jgi:DNA-binding GntR family transcriptional regulator
MVLENPIKKQSLQSMVYESLRQALVQREIEPGEQLNIAKLAKMLNVSTMPVREALRRLEAEGLVTFNSNKRILVHKLSPQDLEDIYIIRMPLEELALLMCLELEDLAGLEVLESLHQRMCRPRISAAQWFDLNRAFHMQLHDMSGSPRLSQILQGLWNSTGPYLRIFSGNPKAVTRANQEHAGILEALRSRDPKKAKLHLRSHLRNGLKSVRVILEAEYNSVDR